MQQPPESFQNFGQPLHKSCNTGRNSFFVGREDPYYQYLAPNKSSSQFPPGTFWSLQDPRRDPRQRSQYWDSGQVQNPRQRSSFWPPEQQISMPSCSEINVYHPVQSEGNIEPPQSQDIDWPYDLPFLWRRQCTFFEEDNACVLGSQFFCHLACKVEGNVDKFSRNELCQAKFKSQALSCETLWFSCQFLDLSWTLSVIVITIISEFSWATCFIANKFLGCLILRYSPHFCR